MEKLENLNDNELNSLVDLFYEFSNKEAQLAEVVVKIGKKLKASKKINLNKSLATALGISPIYITHLQTIYDVKKDRPPNYLKLLEHWLESGETAFNYDPIKTFVNVIESYYANGEFYELYTDEQRKDFHRLLTNMHRFSAKDIDYNFLDPMRWTYCLACGARPSKDGHNIVYAKKIKRDPLHIKRKFHELETLSFYPFPLCDECYDKETECIKEKRMVLNAITRELKADWIFDEFPYRKLADIYLLCIERYFELHKVVNNANCLYANKPTLLLQVKNNK